ncbi:MAG TPA: histidine kinase, partial [Verrucomicrobiae bacterium]|nr:histidine kinase [Verrucomicrobiae bacterium]
ASALLPVRIRGVVTYYEASMGLFVQDETAGVFVYYAGRNVELKPGQCVEVEGVSNQGRYSPIIDSPKIRTLDQETTLTPKRVSLAEIYRGGLDSQWIEVEGVVRKVKLAGNGLGLEVAVPPHRITVWVPHRLSAARSHLEDSLVRVRGVVGTICPEKGPVSDFQIFANRVADIEVLQEGMPDPVSGPLLVIRDLGGQFTRRDPLARVHTRGTVTLCLPGHGLFIQDATGALEVRTAEPLQGIEPGATVEVSGFAGPVLDPPFIEDALVRLAGHGSPPRATRIVSPTEVSGFRHENELIEMEATLLDRSDSASTNVAMVLQSGDRVFTALLPAPNGAAKALPARPGSKLRVTGVCHSELPPFGSRPNTFLLLRSAADVELLGTPVLPPTPGNNGLLLTAALCALGLLAALWQIAKQRRQTEHMLQLQTALQTEMRQGEQQLRRSLEERERIGRDLHDEIIQSIYAVGLNLEDCRRVIRQSPEQAEARVGSAINALNGTIRSVRGFLSGLEPKVLNGSEFRTALKSLALISGEGPTQIAIDVDSSAANRLSSTQATQLLHIAKEAMSNSLRHARASSVDVLLHPANFGVRLEVRDDGIGFDSEAMPGTGHGLRNIGSRARELGAELQIISAKDRGCRIVVTLPQRNPNEHG